MFSSFHVIEHVRANVFSIWTSCHLVEEEVGSVEQEPGVTLICHYARDNPIQSRAIEVRIVSVLNPCCIRTVRQKPEVTFICNFFLSFSLVLRDENENLRLRNGNEN